MVLELLISGLRPFYGFMGTGGGGGQDNKITKLKGNKCNTWEHKQTSCWEQRNKQIYFGGTREHVHS